jgi:hypothetical protein
MYERLQLRTLRKIHPLVSWALYTRKPLFVSTCGIDRPLKRTVSEGSVRISEIKSIRRNVPGSSFVPQPVVIRLIRIHDLMIFDLFDFHGHV